MTTANLLAVLQTPSVDETEIGGSSHSKIPSANWSLTQASSNVGLLRGQPERC